MDAKDWVPDLLDELREQMGNLSAALQLLTPAIREQENRKYDQYLAIATQSLYRMLRLMRSADFADQMERGEEPMFRPAPVDLGHLCDELSKEVESIYSQLGGTFHYEWEGKSPILMADPHLLRRMLLLLLDSALRAAGPHGRAALRLTYDGGRATLTVWDSGLLEEQGEDPMARRTGDLGLGLKIAREIVRLHGGSLVVERRREPGGRVVVSLPVKPVKLGELHAPTMGYDPNGGFSPVMLELSDLLPLTFFLPQNEE